MMDVLSRRPTDGDVVEFELAWLVDLKRLLPPFSAQSHDHNLFTMGQAGSVNQAFSGKHTIFASRRLLV